MRNRPIAAFAALALAQAAPLPFAAPANAQTTPAPSSPLNATAEQLESRLLECDTTAIFSAGRTAGATANTFAWNCSGVGITALTGVHRSAILTRGTIPQATRTLQLAVMAEDGQSACYVTRHFLPPRRMDNGAVFAPYMTSYTYVTTAEMIAGGSSFRPTFVATAAELTGDGARCAAELEGPLDHLTTAIAAPRRTTPPRDQAAPVVDNSI